MEVLAGRVLLRSRDPAATTAFYRDVLELAVAREFPGGTVFFLGGGFLEVSGRSADPPPGPGVALWLQVRDAPAAYAGALSRGAAGIREPRREPWGLVEAWLSDPDGLRIVLVEVPAGHPLRTDLR
jgi:catechol 2,3-dioxygenase-like lactoylglutathione lyase family enzyme